MLLFFSSSSDANKKRALPIKFSIRGLPPFIFSTSSFFSLFFSFPVSPSADFFSASNETNKQALESLAGRRTALVGARPAQLPRRAPATKAPARPRLSLSAAAAPSLSGCSDSSSYSSSSIAQLAPPGALLLPEPGRSSSSSSESSKPDPQRVAVVVVGVDHGDPDASLGSFILSSCPAAVVVETALCARHGRETGTCLSLSSSSSSNSSSADDGSSDFFGGGGGRWETWSGGESSKAAPFQDAEEEHVVQCLQLAERLAALPNGSPERTSFWHALSLHFAGEQLAYVAALSKGSRLVFGDRTKRATVRRLLERLSSADLDGAVAAQAARNTSESLTGAVAPPPPLGGGDFGRAYEVLVRERDATICSAIAREVEREEREMSARGGSGGGGGGGGGETDDASSSASASFPPSAAPSGAPSPSPPPRPIVVVVGKWHLEGVRSLWESGEWRGVLEELEAEERARGGSPPPPPARHAALSASEDLGLRRALVDELLRSTATAGSAEEVDPEAFGGAFVKSAAGEEGEVEEAAARAAFALATELYGTARMQLALLESRQQFDAVVSGWRCDFWESVASVRGVRAANGGKGFFDEEEILTLRGLNYIFEES